MTAYHYDDDAGAGGRLVEKDFYANNTVYNNGNGTAGQTVTYAYDGLGRLTTIDDSLAGTWTYGYDAEGRQTLVDSPQGAIHYEYDVLGRTGHAKLG